MVFNILEAFTLSIDVWFFTFEKSTLVEIINQSLIIMRKILPFVLPSCFANFVKLNSKNYLTPHYDDVFLLYCTQGTNDG